MSDQDGYGLRNRPHVFIDALRENKPYIPPRQAVQPKGPRPDIAAHATALLDQLAIALARHDGSAGRLVVHGIPPGTVVEVQTASPVDRPQAGVVKLPNLAKTVGGLEVLRSERNDDRTESAVVFVPESSQSALRRKIGEYRDFRGEKATELVQTFERVGAIRPATGRSLFVGPIDFDAAAARWFELWVRKTASEETAASVAARAREARFDVHPDTLIFPETTVLYVHARASDLERFAERLSGAVSEIRLSESSIEPILQRGRQVTQHDWVEEMASRVVPPPSNAPMVCALDTGINAAHPLLAPGLRGAWALDDAWLTDDHAGDDGHGTGMAGLALYGDLEQRMGGSGAVELRHGIESMKLLPPDRLARTEPDRYGVVTQAAVALVEVESPGRRRTFCLASSTADVPSSRPSAWSGAIDQLASGAMPGEMVEGFTAADRPKRLVLVATGNTSGTTREEVRDCRDIEDPAQSWNALTIGGMTRKDTPPADPPGLDAVVTANHRSPFSRGSCGLPADLTPVKPEVLFEAGNMTANSSGDCGAGDASVSLLTTGSDHVRRPLTQFWATSGATGIAGNFLGRLDASLPGLWPETLRALTVDSARWPQPINSKFVGSGSSWKSSLTAAHTQQLVREFGYGVPDLERAIASARNDVSLVAQAEIQPFESLNGRPATFKDMHYYALPWPKAALEALEDASVTMRVTLSYFIEPNLAGRAAVRPDTYRSFGLRFDLRKRTESVATFRSRVNRAQAQAASEPERESSRWLLGPKAVQAGSLHCDLWRGRAVDLASHDQIAVFPVGGWWKSHLGQRRANDVCRYALVISISAPGHTVDLHAEVTQALRMANPLDIPV
jgi:hypothetical protein